MLKEKTVADAAQRFACILLTFFLLDRLLKGKIRNILEDLKIFVFVSSVLYQIIFRGSYMCDAGLYLDTINPLF